MRDGEVVTLRHLRRRDEVPEGWHVVDQNVANYHAQFSLIIQQDDMTDQPRRVQILNEGAALTNGDRDQEYGTPFNNMTCAGELKVVFRKWLAREISPGELEALDMAMTKLSRLACGRPKRDTYVDAATYIAIAGEVSGI